MTPRIELGDSSAFNLKPNTETKAVLLNLYLIGFAYGGLATSAARLREL